MEWKEHRRGRSLLSSVTRRAVIAIVVVALLFAWWLLTVFTLEPEPVPSGGVREVEITRDQ